MISAGPLAPPALPAPQVAPGLLRSGGRHSQGGCPGAAPAPRPEEPAACGSSSPGARPVVPDFSWLPTRSCTEPGPGPRRVKGGFWRYPAPAAAGQSFPTQGPHRASASRGEQPSPQSERENQPSPARARARRCPAWHSEQDGACRTTVQPKSRLLGNSMYQCFHSLGTSGHRLLSRSPLKIKWKKLGCCSRAPVSSTLLSKATAKKGALSSPHALGCALSLSGMPG